MIYTFYSYKGGVGRSMALVNIAQLMYQAGLRVLMVDWDLEAPGLERFFPESSDEILDREGLIEMLQYYKEKRLEFDPDKTSSPFPVYENLENYIFKLHPNIITNPTQPKLCLLPAGRRKGNRFSDYASKVITFDWANFYDKWDGEVYFESFREELEQIFDVILIDSRTGLTEMGGVCTYQLADVVVMFTAANEQNLEGSLKMVEKLNAADFQAIRNNAKKPLRTLVFPARVEILTETISLNRFRDKFREKFENYLPARYKNEADRLEIPYIPLYSFEELIATAPDTKLGDKRSPGLEQAYETILQALVVDYASEPVKTKLGQFISLEYEGNLALTIIQKSQVDFTQRIKDAYNQLNQFEREIQKLQGELRVSGVDSQLKELPAQFSEKIKQIRQEIDEIRQSANLKLDSLDKRLTKFGRDLVSVDKYELEIKKAETQILTQTRQNLSDKELLEAKLKSVETELSQTRQNLLQIEIKLKTIEAEATQTQQSFLQAKQIEDELKRKLAQAQQNLLQTKTQSNNYFVIYTIAVAITAAVAFFLGGM